VYLGEDLPSAANGNTNVGVFSGHRATVLLRARTQWGVRMLGHPLVDTYLLEPLGGAGISILLLTVSKKLLGIASWYFREESAIWWPSL
jgi:hypothetical protein